MSMKLDVYRSCSWREKRQVLEAFWRGSPHPDNKILVAARQYAPYAVISLLVIAVELTVVVSVGASRGWIGAWFAGALDLVTVLSLGQAVIRSRRLGSAPLVA